MNACAVYEFRYNEDLVTEDTLGTFLKTIAKSFVFQLEVGDTGYRHWQGRLSLIKRRRKCELMKLFGSFPLANYLEPTLTKEHLKEAFYQMKIDTKVRGPWTEADYRDPTFVPYQYAGLMDKLFPYQQLIFDKIKNEREKRIVNLVVDLKGNSGKSTLAALMDIHGYGVDMPVVNDYEKLVATLCCILKDVTRDPKSIFMDMPRAVDKTHLIGTYCAIEQIKKGKLYDLRNKYKSWWIHAPQVWVFTNVVPEFSLLSQDRWRVWTINDNKELIPYLETI